MEEINRALRKNKYLQTFSQHKRSSCDEFKEVPDEIEVTFFCRQIDCTDHILENSWLGATVKEQIRTVDYESFPNLAIQLKIKEEANS